MKGSTRGPRNSWATVSARQPAAFYAQHKCQTREVERHANDSSGTVRYVRPRVTCAETCQEVLERLRSIYPELLSRVLVAEGSA